MHLTCEKKYRYIFHNFFELGRDYYFLSRYLPQKPMLIEDFSDSVDHIVNIIGSHCRKKRKRAYSVAVPFGVRKTSIFELVFIAVKFLEVNRFEMKAGA